MYRTDLRILSLESGHPSVFHLSTGHRLSIWLVNSGLGNSFARVTVHSQLPRPSEMDVISSSLGPHIHSGSPSSSSTAAGASILKCKSDRVSCSPNYLLDTSYYFFISLKIESHILSRASKTPHNPTPGDPPAPSQTSTPRGTDWSSCSSQAQPQAAPSAWGPLSHRCCHSHLIGLIPASHYSHTSSIIPSSGNTSLIPKTT